jgi:hypothetical protein
LIDSFGPAVQALPFARILQQSEPDIAEHRGKSLREANET